MNIQQELALFDIPADLVRRNFQMNPDNDDLIFGNELKEGMIILNEDSLLRTDPDREEGEDATGFWTDKILEQSRWCRIERFLPDSPNGEIVQFIAIYADGTKRKRTYNRSYAWYVKKSSLPQPSSDDRVYSTGLEDLEKIIAQETSGIKGAIPEQEDRELASDFLKQIANRFERDEDPHTTLNGLI